MRYFIDVGFTGTQHGMTPIQKDRLWSILLYMAPRFFRLGDCIGADKEAYDIVLRMAWAYRSWRRPELLGHIPVESNKRARCKYDVEFTPMPYRERDQQIAENCEIMIAAPRTLEEELRSGTWATARDARRANRSVLILWPDGSHSDLWRRDNPNHCECGTLRGDNDHTCWRGELTRAFKEFPDRPFTFTHAK